MYIDAMKHYAGDVKNEFENQYRDGKIQKAAIWSVITFAAATCKTNSFQVGVVATAIFGAAYAVQVAVTPFFKEFKDSDQKLSPFVQSVKDFTYQVTIIVLSNGIFGSRASPALFAGVFIIDVIWNDLAATFGNYDSDYVRLFFPYMNVISCAR